MQHHPPRKVKNVPLHKMIPNMITLTAMAAGMTSIKFAVNGKWEWAVLAIVVAAFMDAFDGAAARLLKAQSKLGAELDSFSDFACFGIAPAIVMYLWSLHNLPKEWGWATALVFAMSVALRLARFNIAAEEKDPNDPLGKYFTGVPSPIGAGLSILPLIISFQLDRSSSIELNSLMFLRDPMMVALWMLIVAAMMVSHIPTLSSKQLRVPHRMKIVALAAFGTLIASLISQPWPTLSLMGAGYLISVPFGAWHYSRKAAALAKGERDEDDHDTED